MHLTLCCDAHCQGDEVELALKHSCGPGTRGLLRPNNTSEKARQLQLEPEPHSTSGSNGPGSVSLGLTLPIMHRVTGSRSHGTPRPQRRQGAEARGWRLEAGFRLNTSSLPSNDPLTDNTSSRAGIHLNGFSHAESEVFTFHIFIKNTQPSVISQRARAKFKIKLCQRSRWRSAT